MPNEGYKVEKDYKEYSDYYYCGNCDTTLEFEADHCEHCESRDVKYHEGVISVARQIDICK